VSGLIMADYQDAADFVALLGMLPCVKIHIDF
jgi:hypothetical protein